jgi:hypothetical protein
MRIVTRAPSGAGHRPAGFSLPSNKPAWICGIVFAKETAKRRPYSGCPAKWAKLRDANPRDSGSPIGTCWNMDRVDHAQRASGGPVGRWQIRPDAAGLIRPMRTRANAPQWWHRRCQGGGSSVRGQTTMTAANEAAIWACSSGACARRASSNPTAKAAETACIGSNQSGWRLGTHSRLPRTHSTFQFPV